jgi:hypothetical protein
MPSHPLLAEFQKECQSVFACYVFATRGIEDAKKMIVSTSPPKGAHVFISDVDPNEQRAAATLLAEDLVQMMQHDGDFCDTIAKSLLVLLYARWDEYYRPLFAKEIGADSKKVRCNLLGDLRYIRNCIVHAKSVITNEHTKLKVLSWSIAPGPLVVTKEMLTVFVEASHHLIVEVHEA